MGQQHTQLTVIRRVFNRTLSGYEKYNLYVVREPVNPYTGLAREVYILTDMLYTNSEKIWIDLGPDNTEPYKHNKHGLLDGMHIYVIRPTVAAQINGHFNIRARLPATAPEQEFAHQVIKTADYNLYDVEHVREDGKATGTHYKLFSEVSYFKGETVPASEALRLFRRYPSEPPEYFLHDRDAYLKRAVDAFGFKKRQPA